MPTEHVYANVITVHPGDLPVLAARSAADLTQLDRPASPLDRELLRTTQHVAQRVDVLRRRHQLLSQFVESLDAYGDELPTDVRSSIVLLRRALDRLPLGDPPTEDRAVDVDDLVEASSVGDAPDLAVATSEAHVADLRRVQLRVQLGWERDGGQVVLGVDGWDHDRAERVDLGGLHAALDWTAANRLVRKLKVARDQSCGAPE